MWQRSAHSECFSSSQSDGLMREEKRSCKVPVRVELKVKGRIEGINSWEAERGDKVAAKKKRKVEKHRWL